MTDRVGSLEYAGPAFKNSPSASSLPAPKFSKRSSTVSGTSSDSEKSSTSSNNRKSVSFTSDTKSHDGKKVILATSGQHESSNIDKNANITTSASARRSVAFENLVKRIREDNEAQARRETIQHQASELHELRQRQQAIINSIEPNPTGVIIRSTPQETIDVRDHTSTIDGIVRRQVREMQLMRINPQIQELWQETNRQLQDATKRLERNLSKQLEIWQQRLDEAIEKIQGEERAPAEDEMGLPSSDSDEATLVDTETDRDEYHHLEVIDRRNRSLVANVLETIFEVSDETAVEDRSEADQGTPEVEDLSEDEGYYSMEEMVEEQEDEGYFSMEE